MSSYPLIVNLYDKPVAVIGGGKVAARKVKDLLEAGARLTLITPEITEDAEIDTGDISLYWIKRKYRSGDLDGMFLVFTAVDDVQVAQKIAQEASEKKIFLNSAIEPSLSDFTIPSFERKGDLLVTVSTNGASPALAARWRRELMSNLPDMSAGMIAALKEFRQFLLEKEEDEKIRSDILRRIASSDEMLLKLFMNEDEPLKIYTELADKINNEK